MMENGRQPKELICQACFSGGCLCQAAPAGSLHGSRLAAFFWLLLVAGSMVCGCIGVAGSLGVWLHWIGWPFHCSFLMAWRGWLIFSLLPVVGFFLMIGWLPHVMHATGSIGLAILAWFMQTWWVGPAWSSFGNSCMVHEILASVWEFSIGFLCQYEVLCFLQCDDDYSSSVMMVRALLPWFSELGRQSNEKAAKELFSYACFYGLCPLLVGQVVAIFLLLGLLSPARHVSFVRWWHPFAIFCLVCSVQRFWVVSPSDS